MTRCTAIRDHHGHATLQSGIYQMVLTCSNHAVNCSFILPGPDWHECLGTLFGQVTFYSVIQQETYLKVSKQCMWLRKVSQSQKNERIRSWWTIDDYLWLFARNGIDKVQIWKTGKLHQNKTDKKCMEFVAALWCHCNVLPLLTFYLTVKDSRNPKSKNWIN